MRKTWSSNLKIDSSKICGLQKNGDEFLTRWRNLRTYWALYFTHYTQRVQRSSKNMPVSTLCFMNRRDRIINMSLQLTSHIRNVDLIIFKQISKVK